MDTIWNCAFGLDIDIQNNRENEYFKNCEAIFQNNADLSFRLFLGSILNGSLSTY
jgi:hypothetical protein